MSEHRFGGPLTDDELATMLRLRTVVDRVDPTPDLAVDPTALAARAGLVHGTGRGAAHTAPLVRPPAAGTGPAAARTDECGAVSAHPGAGPIQTTRAADAVSGGETRGQPRLGSASTRRSAPPVVGLRGHPPVASCRDDAAGVTGDPRTRVSGGMALPGVPGTAPRSASSAVGSGSEPPAPNSGPTATSHSLTADLAMFFAGLALVIAAAALAKSWGLW